VLLRGLAAMTLGELRQADYGRNGGTPRGGLAGCFLRRSRESRERVCHRHALLPARMLRRGGLGALRELRIQSSVVRRGVKGRAAGRCPGSRPRLVCLARLVFSSHRAKRPCGRAFLDEESPHARALPGECTL